MDLAEKRTCMEGEVSMMKEYKVVLENNVEDYINDGWKLYGNPIGLIEEGGIITFFQAVIKE